MGRFCLERTAHGELTKDGWEICFYWSERQPKPDVDAEKVKVLRIFQGNAPALYRKNRRLKLGTATLQTQQNVEKSMS
jgi:hypothetical protein